MNLMVTFLAGAGATWLLSFPIVRWLRARQVLDRPNERSSHAVPTPRGGGLAVMGVLVPGLIVLYAHSGELFAVLLALCAAMLAAISFLDDMRPLRASTRFVIHFVAALLLLGGLAWGGGGENIAIGADAGMTPGEGNGTGWMARGVILCLYLLYLVGYTNAFNFMDGINGISGTQAFISGTGVAVLAMRLKGMELQPVALAGALVAGTAVGFLPHNFPRARVFMGDVGSVPLGFVTAGLGLVLVLQVGTWLIVPVCLLHANYILDTGITLARRVWRGEKWYEPHREHFYQRLIRSGKSHTSVTSWEGGLQLITLCAAAIYLETGSGGGIGIVAGVLLMWGGFFGWAEARFRSTREQSPDLTSKLASGAAS